MIALHKDELDLDSLLLLLLNVEVVLEKAKILVRLDELPTKIVPLLATVVVVREKYITSLSSALTMSVRFLISFMSELCCFFILFGCS